MTNDGDDEGRRAFDMRVVMNETEWEQALWSQAKTWRPVLELIERVAEQFGRRHLLDRPDHRRENPHVAFTVGEDGRLRGAFSVVDRRAVTYGHAIHGAIRSYLRETSALIIRQRDVDAGDGKKSRAILIARDIQKKSVAAQLRSLETAVRSGSKYQTEAAYFGLSSAAWVDLGEGFHRARRAGDLAGFRGELEIQAEVIARPMLAPDLLRRVLPHARRAAARRGRRAEDAREAALTVVLGVFVGLSGRLSAAARRGDHQEPHGAGADFVRGIEAIFGVHLMPRSSTHAVGRALGRLRRIADRVRAG